MKDDQCTTSIPVRPDVRDRVRALKRGGETYNALLYRLLDQVESQDHDTQR